MSETRETSLVARSTWRDRAIPLSVVWIIVIAASALPLAWMVAQVAFNPIVLSELQLDEFRLKLLGRTLLYNGIAGLIATILALPVAIVLGRGRGWMVRGLWLILPVSLLLPSITYAYAWKQFVRLSGDFWLHNFGVTFAPASQSDVFRCIWSLAGWLWPLPAGLIGLSLLRADISVQQQAVLDGAYWRVTLRLLAGPLLASLAIASVLALQEFSVYEPTGISVVATEVRMVFDTGAYAAIDNSMDAPILASKLEGEDPFPVKNGDALISDEAPLAASRTAPATTTQSNREDATSEPAIKRLPSHAEDVVLRDTFGRLREQRARAAAALATAIPLLTVIALLTVVAIVATRRAASHTGELNVGDWPRVLDAGMVPHCLTALVLLLMIVLPFWSLIHSLHRSIDPVFIWKQFAPQASGSLVVAGMTAVIALILAAAASASPVRGAIALALATFLIGGQLLAIAQIRLYNWPRLHDLVYNGPPIAILAYLSRFAWVSLAAARTTWSRPWRELREQAAIDGAGAMQTSLHVIAPIAAPLLAASALLVGILALTEVPASVLLAPQRPQLLTPTLMMWVHMMRYDAMIEGALLMTVMVFVLTSVALVLAIVARRRWRVVG
jgi:ABC-type Fe3+ transport system permease subunit